MFLPFCYEDEVIELIGMYRDMFFPEPDDPDLQEDIFNHRCDQIWAINDLIDYVKENLYENTPFEIISDYIDDCRYRAEKYKDTHMGPVYTTAKQTAESVLNYFVCEV